MKKSIISLIFALVISAATFGQITGIKTIPGDYPTISAAIVALNASGVGTGGATFNVAAGYTEIFTSLTSGLITTITSTSANPIVFKKNGTGLNPVITSATGTAATTEYIIGLQGTDYITFDGINLTDPSGTIEWGYAIMKASATDGAQYVTIKNCTVTMNSTNINTIGILSNNITPAVPGTQLTVTATSGANSGLKIYSNTIANSYTGIYLKGYADAIYPYTYYDQNNEIGKDGANIITNVGGGTGNGYGIYTSYQNALKVANNNLTSTMAGTGTVYGIYLTTALNGSYDLYNNNVNMQFSGTGAGDNLYAIYCDMGANGATNVVNVYNNTVASCTFPTMTSAYFYGIYLLNLGVTNTVYGNNVSNNVTGSATATATGRDYYLYASCASSAMGTLEMHDNTVSGNTRIQSVTGGGINQFIYAGGKGNLLNFYNNTVTNNVGASNGGTYLLNVSYDYGTRNIYNNLASGITKAEGTVYGLYSYNITSLGGTSYFFRNKVTNIEGLTTGSTIYGIYNTTTSGNTYFYNNMVSDLRNPASTGVNSLVGFYVSSSNLVGAYNNTIYLNGSSTGANYGTSAFYSSSAANLLDLRNNIFANNSVANGTGKTTGIFFNFTALTGYGSLCNYNDIYVPAGTSNYLFWNSSTGDQTLAAFQLRMTPRDLQTITELPPFVSTSASAMDVHLKTTVATQCESGGSVIANPVAITTDFDNNPRYPNSGYPTNGINNPNAPDIGADELGGIPADVTPPSIIFTPLANVSTGTARTLTAIISDGSNVPSSGIGLPRLYWKINTGAWQFATGTFVSGNTYTFTFGAGAVLGDVVYYYIAAQDMAPIPNAAVYAWVGATGITANPPACATPANVLNTYFIQAGISGTFHVGVGKDYATLTAAVADINGKVISGPVTLILDDATYPSEIYPITLLTNAGSSAVNTLTIKPNTAITTSFSTSIAGGYGVIQLSGFDYLTIDGSNNGTISKNLTIENKSTTTGAYTINVYNNGTDPVTNFTLKNCFIKGTPVNSSIVTMDPIRFLSTTGSHDNCIITNNTIIGGFDAIVLSGATTGIITNTQITNNMIGSYLDAEAITRIGVNLQYADNTLISGNEIMGPYSGSLNTGQTGIYMNTGATNTKIRKNKIHDFYHNSDDGWGASGIWYASDASTVTEISNNLIYDIKAPGINPGVGQNITYGMFFRSGGNVKIWHNTVQLSGPYLSTQYDASSACLGFYYQATGGNFELRDNILRNSMVPTTLPGSSLGKAYGIMISTPPGMFTFLNNNDYFIDGYNGLIAQKYTNGYGIDFDFATMASWQGYTGQEANSITVNPVFTSATNLLPTTAAMPHAGVYILGVPTDYNGTTRTNPPDMGAYEFTANPLINTLAASAILNNTATLNGNANATGTTFNLFFDYGTTTAYGSSTAAIPGSVTGSSLNGMSAGLTGLSGLTTYHYRARGVTSGGITVYGNDMTFTTIADPPSVVTTSASAVASTIATLNGTVNANNATTTASFEYGLTTAYGTTINATPSTVAGAIVTNVSAAVTGFIPNQLYHYRAKGINSTGTTNGNDMTFTTTMIAAAVVTNLANPVGTTTATLNGTVTANNAATTVSFQWGPTVAYGNTVSATPASVSGMTGTSVSAGLTGLSINATYHFRCVGVNAAGTTYGADQVFATNCVAPVITLAGAASTCSGTGGYVYSTETGMSGYIWSVSAGGTITAGQGTSSVTVTWNTAGAQTVSVNYSNTFGCSAAMPFAMNVLVNASPVPAITGSATACANWTNNTYSTQSGMTGYVWTLSAGVTITAGQGTSAITVTWTTTGAKTVTANYANASGCLAPSATVMNVTVNAIPSPTITGQNNVCANSGFITYSTESGMTGYVWTLSAGGTFSSGQGTSLVQVTWTGTGAQTLSVNYANASACMAVSPSVMNVTVNGTPAAAGTITGTATVASGANTNAITVNVAGNASSGNITVAGNNLCGNGNASPNFAVTVNALPANAGTITGDASVCLGSAGHVYSVPVISNATNYTWSLPTGATITSGQNSSSVTVSFGSAAVSGNITVLGVNTCGNGAVSPNFAVATHPVPAAPVVTVSGNVLTSSAPSGNQWYYEGTAITGATGQTYTVTHNTGYYSCEVTLSGCSSPVSNKVWVVMTGVEALQASNFNIYPVPNDGRFTVTISSPVAETYSIVIYNQLGAKVYALGDVQVNSTFARQIDLRPVADGIYSVVFFNNSHQVVKKVLINK